ncbi:MAG: alanine/glycine:cation symporter family protein [Phycisphaerales bacterium JB040]
MQGLNDFIGTLNGYLFSDYTVYALLAVGVLFTVWSGFGQYRALTHGVAVVRGKYDDHDDPGAINHFQALSAALSATVGLGNIGGVALAVALGGPGAVLWMWLIGLLGMALKMTEVTQSMLYRNTDDPENPHGGPMFVVKKGFAKWGLGPIGAAIGGIFVVTLLISALTGGNMFQAWNVADITFTYFEVPHYVTGVILAIAVGLVIIGGIKRIGSVAGKIVPVMCLLYVAAALYVIFMNIGDIPAMLALIVKSGLPGGNPEATGAFLGGTFGYAAMWGVKRALFSSEAGQGSSPIAHSAAKTDEPVREGVVAGLEPFIDTIVVCTLTALVILSSGAYNRPAEAFPAQGAVSIVQATDADGQPIDNNWTIESGNLPMKSTEARRILRTPEGQSGWRDGETVFVVVQADEDPNTGRDLRRISGTVSVKLPETETDRRTYSVNWTPLVSETEPTFRTREDGTPDSGIYSDYAGASLTAHAFDRVTPGLGMWLVSIAAWLFALSTMISWSYYGEQGVYYLFGNFGAKSTASIVFLYKLIYCALILLTTVAAMPLITQADGSKKALIGTDAELDMWTTLGLGVMLVANIPIMLIFGAQAMKAYHAYFKKMDAGGDPPHEAPPVTDVVEGKDVE